jgi:hypothetical protein
VEMVDVIAVADGDVLAITVNVIVRLVNRVLHIVSQARRGPQRKVSARRLPAYRRASAPTSEKTSVSTTLSSRLVPSGM